MNARFKVFEQLSVSSCFSAPEVFMPYLQIPVTWARYSLKTNHRQEPITYTFLYHDKYCAYLQIVIRSTRSAI